MLNFPASIRRANRQRLERRRHAPPGWLTRFVQRIQAKNRDRLAHRRAQRQLLASLPGGGGESGPRRQNGDYHAELARDFLKYVRAPFGLTRLLGWSALARRIAFAGKKVLVVGCGRGKDCTAFVEFGASEIHGLDPCDDVGADFRHRRVTYHRSSAEKMDLPTGAFDFVYSIATMEHIQRIELAFAEMVRVARPGGLVYCVAAPLWNSREGHHKFGFFPGEPWIHLRMSEEQLLEHCRRHGLPADDGGDIAPHVAFIFTGYFNRAPAARYVEACARLPVTELVENVAYREPPESLPEAILRELEPRGYTRDELLSLSHKLVARR